MHINSNNNKCGTEHKHEIKTSCKSNSNSNSSRTYVIQKLLAIATARATTDEKQTD